MEELKAIIPSIIYTFVKVKEFKQAIPFTTLGRAVSFLILFHKNATFLLVFKER